MSKIFQLEGGQYEHPNEYKLVSTIRGTTILQPEFGTVIIEGDVIEASTHNTIQKNGVLASKVNVTRESTDTVLVPTDMTIESDLFNELKIMLLFETGTTLPSNSFIKLKDTNIPIANVNDYVVNANTPLLFLYFDSKFYAYKAGEGASTGAESLGDLSDVTLTSPTSGQALVYNGTNFINQTVEEPASKLDDLSDVTLTSPTSGQALVYDGTNFVNQTIPGVATQIEVNAGSDDTKIVTSKKLKARLDSMLASIGTQFVKLTQLATESIAGIIKISTTAQVTAGTDNTTAVSPAKLIGLFTAGLTKTQNGYQKLPGGLIVQWGMVADSGVSVLFSVTFPVAFPTGCTSLQITRGVGSSANGASEVVGLSNTAFTVDSVTLSTDKSLVYWFAIGY